MTKRTWRSGPPPSVGWYKASVSKAPYVWRWWDGKCWSVGVWPHHPSQTAARLALEESYFTTDEIKWTAYWPKNARVPDTRDLKGYK